MKEAVLLLVGAFLGALFGYWFALYQQHQELQARHDMLLRLLADEMSQIAPMLDSYKVEKAYYRDPIRIGVPERLLEDGVLAYDKDERLIQLLLNLNVAVARHNDFVQMTNLAQATIQVPDNIHAQWYDLLREHVSAVTSVRDEIVKELKARDK